MAVLYAATMPRMTTPRATTPRATAPRATRKVDSGSAPSGALRSLVGAGPSQVGVVGALRARDVSRPDDDDLTRAAAAPQPTATTAKPAKTAKTANS